MLFFLLVFLAVLAGAHLFLYISAVYFFSLTSSSVRMFLAGVFLFLSWTFVISYFIVHRWENFFTRLYYIFSGWWLGLLVNLVLAAAALWIVHWGFKFLKTGFDPGKMAIFFLIGSIAFTAWGTWNAFHPVLKRLEVKIENLPENWQGKKVIHLTDIHLGIIYRQEFAEKIAALIEKESPEAVFITGDLFDGMDGKLLEIAQPLGAFRARRGVFYVNGNHETYLGLEKSYRAVEKIGFKILKDEVIDLEGLKIIGISYPERGARKSPAQTLEKMQSSYLGKPNILLYHSPAEIEKIKEQGVTLQLSGHTHKGQIFPFNFITNLVYNGFDYGSFRIGSYNLYVSSGVGTWGPAVRTGNRPEVAVITLR